MASPTVAVCDLDGTLVDSDAALVAPFLALGVRLEDIGRGRPAAEECARHGITIEEFVAAYDTEVVQPYPGAAELVARLDRWAVCSNKHQDSGRAELARLGWQPEVALFTDAFDGPKALAPVLAAHGGERRRRGVPRRHGPRPGVREGGRGGVRPGLLEPEGGARPG